MNSIKQVPSRVKSRRTEANLGAEREHFDKQQVHAQANTQTNVLVAIFWVFYLKQIKYIH